jgi:small-conductance mechanosensitive channel
LLAKIGPLEAWQWIALLVVLVTSVVLATVLAPLILSLVRRGRTWTSALGTRRASLALVWPLRLTFLGILLYTGFGVLGLPETISGPLRSVSATLAITSVVWLIYQGLRLSAAYSTRLVGTVGHQAVLTSLVFGILRILVIIVGVFLMAEIWSVPYTSVLAGLGIGGLAVALAAQPTLQNMIAGFTLFADNPLSVGDFCRYDGNLGTVEEIGLRSTRIRTLDRTVVSIPNTAFADMQLENFTRRDRILLRTTINLRYETTADQLRYVLAEIRRLLIAHPKIHPDPARARFAGFGAHSLDVELFAYVCTSDFNEFLAVREDVYLRMMKLVLDSGTGFAFPSQVNYLARDSSVDDDRRKKAEAMVAVWRDASQLPFPEFAPSEVHDLDGRLDYPPEGSPGLAGDHSKDSKA